MGAAAAEADCTLFVGNLEAKVTEELLFELFHQVSGADRAPAFVFRPSRSAQTGPGSGGRAARAGLDPKDPGELVPARPCGRSGLREAPRGWRRAPGCAGLLCSSSARRALPSLHGTDKLFQFPCHCAFSTKFLIKWQHYISCVHS